MFPRSDSGGSAMSRAVVTAAVFLLCAGLARAQTTDTEREAAAAILRQFDSLETGLKPTEPALRLATRADPARDRLLARVAAVWTGEMQGLSDWIGHHPEVGWHEFQAFDTLTAVLRGYGFTVDTGVAGLPTAFTATWTSPAGATGPTLGLIAEYDALRGTQGDFHRDQHNAQSPVALRTSRAGCHPRGRHRPQRRSRPRRRGLLHPLSRRGVPRAHQPHDGRRRARRRPDDGDRGPGHPLRRIPRRRHRCDARGAVL